MTNLKNPRTRALWFLLISAFSTALFSLPTSADRNHSGSNSSAEFFTGSGLSEGPVASSACNALCAGVADAAEHADGSVQKNWAACFSCRCKSAIGWLPPADELKCSSGTHLDRYRAVTDDNGNTPRTVLGLESIDPDREDTSGCLNGGIAAAGCDLQSRFKRLVNDKAEFQLLCRKTNAHAEGYYEYLIIGNNTESGATCFWQARSDTFDGEQVPNLDLTDANHAPIPDAVSAYVDTFYLYSAGPSECTSCHASDAFIWSPYLHSAFPVPMRDPQVLDRLAGPYFKVSAASDRLQPVGHRFLVAGPTTPEAPSTPLGCTNCHRVADGTFCSSMSWQAVGHSERAGTNGYEPNSAFMHARRLLFWMPPTGANHTSWVQRSEDDVNRIRNCCVDGNNASCQWTDQFN